jgi:hypothetical protein
MGVGGEWLGSFSFLFILIFRQKFGLGDRSLEALTKEKDKEERER